MQISTDVIRFKNTCFCLCYEVQILLFLLNAGSQGTRFNMMVAKIMCSHGTLSLIAKIKKSPPQLSVQVHLKVITFTQYRRYGFVSEVGKIITEKK